MQTHRETKSLGAEDTFMHDLDTIEEMHEELDKIAITVFNRLQKNKLEGRTITLKIKYSDFTQITRNLSFSQPIGDFNTILETAKQLLEKVDREGKTIRLLGISLSNFGEIEIKPRKPRDPEQLELFGNES